MWARCTVAAAIMSPSRHAMISTPLSSCALPETTSSNPNPFPSILPPLTVILRSNNLALHRRCAAAENRREPQQKHQQTPSEPHQPSSIRSPAAPSHDSQPARQTDRASSMCRQRNPSRRSNPDAFRDWENKRPWLGQTSKKQDDRRTATPPSTHPPKHSRQPANDPPPSPTRKQPLSQIEPQYEKSTYTHKQPCTVASNQSPGMPQSHRNPNNNTLMTRTNNRTHSPKVYTGHLSRARQIRLRPHPHTHARQTQPQTLPHYSHLASRLPLDTPLLPRSPPPPRPPLSPTPPEYTVF